MSGINLRNLARRVNKVAEAFEKNASALTIEAARKVDTLIVFAMPVDTGRARSSVVVTLDAPTQQIVPTANFPGVKGSTGTQNAQSAIDQAESNFSVRQFEQPIYININLEYIGALNQGHSPQASPGFIEQSIKDGISDFSSNVDLFRG